MRLRETFLQRGNCTGIKEEETEKIKEEKRKRERNMTFCFPLLFFLYFFKTSHRCKRFNLYL